jgi:hypothetical protein
MANSAFDRWDEVTRPNSNKRQQPKLYATAGACNHLRFVFDSASARCAPPEMIALSHGDW